MLRLTSPLLSPYLVLGLPLNILIAQSRTTAPIKLATNCPMSPVVPRPKRDSKNPPMKAPTTPTMISTQIPNPWPFTNIPANQPDKAPMIKNQIILLMSHLLLPIILSFRGRKIMNGIKRKVCCLVCCKSQGLTLYKEAIYSLYPLEI